MSFINPNGLWFLLGIPVLIILYIIKQKFTDRTISSSFIWRKSAELIKKNIRWRKLLKYVLFALQILIIAGISLVVARPVFSGADTGTDYYVIIDGSASMLAETNGETRFDRAVGEIEDLAADMQEDSEMTVIFAADNSFYIVRQSDSFSVIDKALKNLECGLSDADIDGAVTLAQTEAEGAANAVFILYTDKDYEDTGDIAVVNMSDGEWNAAVLNLSVSEDHGQTTFMSTVASYGADQTLTLALYVDGVFKDAQLAECSDGVPTDVYWDALELDAYSQAEVTVEADDAVSVDNSYVLCGGGETAKDVLIVGKTSYFLENVIDAVGDFNITTANSLDTIPTGVEDETADPNALSGYDLYVFDGVTPDTLPDDGAVWIIDPGASVSTLELGDTADGGGLSVSSGSSSETLEALTNYLDLDEIVVSEYTQLTSYDGYEPVLSCGDDPVLLVKTDADHVTTLVLMFDIHASNLPLLADFPLLAYNMTQYSVLSVLDDRSYTVDEDIAVNALPGCSGIVVTDESGTDYNVTIAASSGIFTPEKTGVYTVTEIGVSGSDVSVDKDTFFVHIDASESDINAKGTSLGLGSAAEGTAAAEVNNGFFARLFSNEVKLWPYLAMLLLVILLMEWWLYYREEY